MTLMNGQNRADIKQGLEVDVVLKADQPTGKLTRGMVGQILTSSSFHPRGIKVRLKDGQVGRVQNIVSSGNEQTNAIEQIHVTAEAFRAAVEQGSGIKLNYDAESILKLDQIIDRVLASPPQDLDQTILLFACFFGEALTKILNGKWGVNKSGNMSVILQASKGDRVEANIFAKVEKRFRSGMEDSLTDYFQMLQKVRN